MLVWLAGAENASLFRAQDLVDELEKVVAELISEGDSYDEASHVRYLIEEAHRPLSSRGMLRYAECLKDIIGECIGPDSPALRAAESAAAWLERRGKNGAGMVPAYLGEKEEIS